MCVVIQNYICHVWSLITTEPRPGRTGLFGLKVSISCTLLGGHHQPCCSACIIAKEMTGVACVVWCGSLSCHGKWYSYTAVQCAWWPHGHEPLGWSRPPPSRAICRPWSLSPAKHKEKRSGDWGEHSARPTFMWSASSCERLPEVGDVVLSIPKWNN